VEGPACTAAETFTNGHLTEEFGDAHGLAVNSHPSKTLYVTGGPQDEKGEVGIYSVVTVPGVSTVKPSAVTGSVVTLAGTVNPSGVALAKCFFEYGETEAYGHVANCVEGLGSSQGEGTDAVVGPDRVFTTRGEGAFRLPDGREWELVSSRDRHGAFIEPLGSNVDAGGQIQASSDGGGGGTYVTNIPTESGVRGFTEFGQVLSSRTSGGWVSKASSLYARYGDWGRVAARSPGSGMCGL
jgi:hypothetical protein